MILNVRAMRASHTLRWLAPLLLGAALGVFLADANYWHPRNGVVLWILKVPTLYGILYYPSGCLFYCCRFLHIGPSGHCGVGYLSVVRRGVLGDVRTAHRLVVASQAGSGNLCRRTPIHRLGCGVFGDTGRPSASELRGCSTGPSPSHPAPIVAAGPDQTSARSVTLFSPQDEPACLGRRSCPAHTYALTSRRSDNRRPFCSYR